MGKILLIDNENIIKIRIINILKSMGYDEIESIGNNQVTLERLTHHLKDTVLIIMDTELDETSGIELAESLQHNLQYSEIPIIFISSHSDIGTVHSAIDAGAVDYIIKPFEDETLIDKVSKILGEPPEISEENHQMNIKDFIDTIKLEFERAERAKYPITFLEISYDKEELSNEILAIENIIRKIDIVQELNEKILIVLPITDEEGGATLLQKIKEVTEYRKQNIITFEPEENSNKQEIIDRILDINEESQPEDQ